MLINVNCDKRPRCGILQCRSAAALKARRGSCAGVGEVERQTLRRLPQTEVAENWIPFIPVHLDGQLRAIQLQRGTMRRTIGPDDTLIRPVTSILRAGIDADDNRQGAYYVHEEEVPRAGVQVQGLLRRARRYDGTPVVWHARRVTTGRGEARSGLAFDRITQ